MRRVGWLSLKQALFESIFFLLSLLLLFVFFFFLRARDLYELQRFRWYSRNKQKAERGVWVFLLLHLFL